MFGFINNQNKTSDSSSSASIAPTPSPSANTITSSSTVSVNGYSSPYLDPEKDLKLSEPVSVATPQNTNQINVVQQFDELKNMQTTVENVATQPPSQVLNTDTSFVQFPPTATSGIPSSTSEINIIDLGPTSTPSIAPQIETPDFAIQPIETVAPAYNTNSLNVSSNQPMTAENIPLKPILPNNNGDTTITKTDKGENLLTLDPDPFPLEVVNIPSVEQLASPAKGDYTTNPLQDTTLDPENDLGMTAEIINSIKSNNNTVVNNKLDIKSYLDLMIEKDASDLHLSVGYAPKIRVDGKLIDIGEILTEEQVNSLITQILNTNQKELLDINREIDLSYNFDKARFRVNAYHEKGQLAAAFRLIPHKIRSIEDLGLPRAVYDFTTLSQGLFLVTGPTGSGKSTTIAAMIQEINAHHPVHIITIEDPIEYIYPKGKALIDQRELGQDTHDWNIALRSILRQDPDVVVIGEMRDFETIQLALTIAETGHLVFATLHTNSSPETIDRIIDVFPPHQQTQIRTQLASTLKGVLTQRLIPKIGGGREAATELLIVNSAVQNLIREAKVFQIDNVLSTSFDLGMFTLEKSLVKKIREGKITVETAQEHSIRPKEILKLMKSS